MKPIWIVLAAFVWCAEAIAWQGVNLDTGTVIDVRIDNVMSFTEGNIRYFDYDAGELKLGYLSMYEQNFGLIVDLDSGDLLRVQMSPAEQTSQ